MIKININADSELRELSQRDLKMIFDVVNYNRIYLKRWLPWLDYTTTSHRYVAMIKSWQQNIELGTGMELGLFYQEQFIGMCGFTTIEPNSRRGQIGYWISKDFEGRGLMRKSVEAVVSYGFNELNLNRIEIVCGDNNFRSRKLPESLDFTKEGIMKEYEFLYDHFHDCILYRMLRSEWQPGDV